MSHHFFIWTVRRTGGSSLKRALEHISDNPVIEAEAFNSDRMLGYDNEEEKLLQRFEEIRGKYYCIKHCWELHKPQFNNMILDFAKQEGYRFVLLTRENVLEMLISLELAYQTKVWGRGQIGNISNYENRDFSDLNLKRMKNNCKKYTSSLEKYITLLTQKKVEWIEVSHEQLYRGSQENRLNHLNKLCEFLDISQDKINQNYELLCNELINQKQNSYKVYSKIPNILEAKKEFSEYSIDIDESDNTSKQNVRKNEDNIKIYLDRGHEFKKQRNLLEAIEQYKIALTKNPKSVPALRELGTLYQAQGKIDRAIKYYQQVIAVQPKASGIYAKLADVFSKQGKIDEAISAYEQAIEFNPNLYFQVYINFGKALENQGRVSEAVSNYKKALEVTKSENHDVYLTLAKIYLEKDLLDDAIACYQKAVKLKSELPYSTYATLIEALKQKGRYQEAVILLNSLKEGKTYLQIWQGLNQVTLENLHNVSTEFPQKLNQNHVLEYFQQVSQYKVINLESINEEEESFLDGLGLSLTYLKQNQYIVNQKNIQKEKIERGKFGGCLDLAIKDGSIYAVCPTTGKIVKSERSFLTPLPESFIFVGAVFYRFVGHEVFYLFCCDQLTKLYLYFPRIDLIVQFSSNYKIRRYEPSQQGIAMLKSFLVTNWVKVKSYISSESDVRKVALLPNLARTPWHQVHNYLAPIHELSQNSDVYQIDKLCILDKEGAESCFGSIDEIFPEINLDRIKRANLAHKILENNFFVFNVKFEVASQYISNGLAEKIYQASRQKCSLSFLAEIEEAKEKHFPLLWIGFRNHKRTWVSKVEGIANIIKSLYKTFPNLGIIFDGFTRTDIKGELFVSSAEEEKIQNEKDVLNQIQSRLPTEIKVYDIIGSPMHEVIMWAYAIDLYMAPVGSGLIKVRIPNKPGIVHSSTLYGQLRGHETMRENCVTPVPIPDEKIVKKLQEGEKESDSSYDFDWKIAYEELLKMASSITRAG